METYLEVLMCNLKFNVKKDQMTVRQWNLAFIYRYKLTALLVQLDQLEKNNCIRIPVSWLKLHPNHLS